MTNTERTEEEQRAYDAGVERGWDHANFVDAYGKEHDRRTPDYPSWLSLDTTDQGFVISGVGSRMSSAEATKRIALRTHFAEGWKEGRKRFRQGRYPDGTKIEN